MLDSSEQSLLLSQLASLEVEEFVKNLDEDDLDEADRIKATGFNILRAAKTRYACYCAILIII